MINFEQIRALMKNVQANQPTFNIEEHETPPTKEHLPKLYVSKKDKRSLLELKSRLEDMGCYSTVHVTKTVAISGQQVFSSKLIGQFDYSKIFCKDCSYSIKHENATEHMDYGVIMQTPSGMGTPSALLCSSCGTNFVKLISQI